MSRKRNKTVGGQSVQPPAPQAGLPQALGSEHARGEVAGCPTGLTDPDQAQIVQQPGGGGAPGTGAADPSVPPSPGEGVTEEQMEASEKDAASHPRGPNGGRTAGRPG